MWNQDNSSSSSNESPEDWVRLEIQLSEYETTTWVIKSTDIIENIIDEFCTRHNLSNSIKEIINQQVIAQLDEEISKLENSSNSSSQNSDNQIIIKKNINENNDSIKFDNVGRDMLSPMESSVLDESAGHIISTPYNNGTESKNKNNSHSKFYRRTINKNSFHDHDESSAGERMYIQCVEQKEKKEEKLRQKREEQEIENSKELVFHPKINKKSLALAPKTEGKIEDKLIKIGKEQRHNQIKSMTKQELLESKKNTFHPNIPQVSKNWGDIRRRIRMEQLPKQIKGINNKYIVKNKTNRLDISFTSVNPAGQENHMDSMEEFRSVPQLPQRSITPVNHDNFSSLKSKYSNDGNNESYQFYSNYILNDDASQDSSRKKKSKIYHRDWPVPQLNPEKSWHDYWYIESKIMNQKKENEYNEYMRHVCTFTPHISQKVREWVKNQKETKSQFINRLSVNKAQNEEIKLIKRRNVKNDSRDCKMNLVETKKNTFKPTISRGPKTVSQRDVTTNWDSYYDRKLWENKNKLEDTKLMNVREKKKFFFEHGMDIIWKMKFDKYKEIFNWLDSDRDGFISSNKIKLSELDQDILEALTPLFQQWQDSGEDMPFKEFCWKVDKLWSVKIFSAE